METREFLSQARIEAQVLHTWMQAGWLLPQRDSHAYQFSEIDLARAHLIRDLKYDLEVNDEGIPIILDLVDQLHGLRRTLSELLATIAEQPETAKRQFPPGIRDTRSRRRRRT